MKNFLVPAILAALATLIIAAPVMAREGTYLGVDLGYNNIVGTDSWFDPVDNAVGLGLKFGYNFGTAALEGELIGSSHNDDHPDFSDGDFRGLSANLRLFLSQPLDPNQVYLLVGVGAYSFEHTDFFLGQNYEFTGGGFNLGGGLEHFLNERTALNIAGIYRFIRYDDVEINGISFDPSLIDGEDGDVFSITVGFNFYFY